MREILYRAKAINRIEGREYLTDYKNGDWVYGLVTRLYDERYELVPATMTNTDGVSGIDVDYKTISEFTGLTDKNGTKIFEGDICKLENIETGFVKYGDTAEFRIVFDEGSCDFAPLSNYNFEIEVIGNKWDNPELLKGE